MVNKGQFKKGGISPRKGIMLTKETKEKISKSKQGQVAWNKGLIGFNKGHPNYNNKEPWNKGIRGEKSHMWKENSNYNLRRTNEYSDWRMAVFERDLFTCQICNKSGCYLEAHHIKSFAEFKDLRFEISNGITLCSDCHIKIDKFRRLFK